MPRFTYHEMMKQLDELRGSDLFFLQVGANDGVTHDPLSPLIANHPHWSGLMIEPIPHYYDQLSERYSGRDNIKCLNVAVTGEDGPAEMVIIDPETITKHDLPDWATGASSLYRDRNALGFDQYKDLTTTVEVKGQTLPTILDSHDIEQIDLLQIDAEGHDFQILNQLDFNRYRPLVIHLEVVNLPPDEETATRNLLNREGYLHVKSGYDRLAVQPELLSNHT